MTVAQLFLYAAAVFLLFSLLALVADYLDWRDTVRHRKRVRLNLRRGGLL